MAERGETVAQRRRGIVMRNYWFGPFSMALIGLAWASMSVIALPSAEHTDLRAEQLPLGAFAVVPDLDMAGARGAAIAAGGALGWAPPGAPGH